MPELPSIIEKERLVSPTVTPQALAWHDGLLWMGSRDLRRIYAINPTAWTVREEIEAPGIPWAAVSTGDALWFTLGMGAADDRYVCRFEVGKGFSPNERFACPDFTGSYLSYDGGHLYLSQWYKGRILQMDRDGAIAREIIVGEEICGHTFLDGMTYVLRGTEQNGESWRLCRLNPRDENPQVEELAQVPFASRSLTHDGRNFWSNHRAANETVCFSLA
jgi:hypothetical protein